MLFARESLKKQNADFCEHYDLAEFLMGHSYFVLSADGQLIEEHEGLKLWLEAQCDR